MNSILIYLRLKKSLPKNHKKISWKSFAKRKLEDSQKLHRGCFAGYLLKIFRKVFLNTSGRLLLSYYQISCCVKVTIYLNVPTCYIFLQKCLNTYQQRIQKDPYEDINDFKTCCNYLLEKEIFCLIFVCFCTFGMIHLVPSRNFLTNISYPLVHTRTCAYKELRNVSFSENFAYVLNESFLSKIIHC